MSPTDVNAFMHLGGVEQQIKTINQVKQKSKNKKKARNKRIKTIHKRFKI